MANILYHNEAVQNLQEQIDNNQVELNVQLHITELCICESAAGYYIGFWCIEDLNEYPGAPADHEPMWCPQPYDRLSGYYTTKEDAEKAFAQFE